MSDEQRKLVTRALIRAFLGLSDSFLLRLRLHYHNQTPFLFGEKANLFSDGTGAACPSLCAAAEKIPLEVVKEGHRFFPAADSALDVFTNRTHGTPLSFLQALELADQRIIRRAIKVACERRNLWRKPRKDE